MIADGFPRLLRQRQQLLRIRHQLAAFGGQGDAVVMAGVLTIAFGLCEWLSPSPTWPRSLFARRTFSVCVAIGMVLNFGMYGVLFIESLYLQNVRQLSPLAAGLMILPFTVMPTVTARVIARFSSREHLRIRLVIGQVLAALVRVSWD